MSSIWRMDIPARYILIIVSSALALRAAIALDDRCFEGHALQARHMQRDVSGGRDEIPIVMSAAISLPGLVSLVARHLRHFLRAAHSAFLPRFCVSSRN